MRVKDDEFLQLLNLIKDSKVFEFLQIVSSRLTLKVSTYLSSVLSTINSLKTIEFTFTGLQTNVGTSFFKNSLFSLSKLSLTDNEIDDDVCKLIAKLLQWDKVRLFLFIIIIIMFIIFYNFILFLPIFYLLYEIDLLGCIGFIV